jgi:putative tryptophan/tyrosine transport system substrate-binding protein
MSTRREFITLVGGAAAAWPLAARAQQPERVRRVGMISGIADEAVTRARLAAFLPALQRLGWTEGRNVQIEYLGAMAILRPCGEMRRN